MHLPNIKTRKTTKHEQKTHTQQQCAEKTTKQEQNKKNNNNTLLNSYNEFYFLSQIGNWSQMNHLADTLNASIKPTKWHTPFQFLKVKMYAQQKQDNLAMQLLDSIIMNNKRS